MSGSDITEYFDSSESRAIREDLVLAVNHVQGRKVAVDCGCGAGADIAYLASIGYTVYGFDIEEESIARCQSRFKNNDNIILTKSTFVDYEYPKASLVVADASLFFCAVEEFPGVWKKVIECLDSGGIFCGSFLGPEDTMAAPGANRSRLWSEVMVFEESELMQHFERFEIISFKTHRSTGNTAQSGVHHWHVFQVVARAL